MAARKKKSSRPKPRGKSVEGVKGARGVKAAKSARPAARPKARPAARPKATPTPAASAGGVVYSDVRREAAMRRFLRRSG
jgi:hypothetical protein